jgi:phosphoribosylformimino-5-aminoimidazole carboxamide ribotide isomerase
MIVIPAIDLREGACVQLVGGRYEDERVRLDDPVAVARDWGARGLRRLHVVDLDAATGRGANLAVIRRLLAEPELEFQVGGGVRSRKAIEDLLALGAARVIVGTRAVLDAPWLRSVAAAFPGRLMVAADVRGRNVLARGWQETTGVDLVELLARLDALPLAGVLVTAVHREGQMAGTDLALVERILAHSRLPLHVAGGVTTSAELAQLAALGCHAAVIGMALYSGALSPDQLEEYTS